LGKEILIVKNNRREGPGLLEDVIKENKIGYTIVEFSLSQNYRSVKNYGAIIVLGGPDSANDQNEKIKRELSLIREALDANIPYLGICLGLQVFVKAAGGGVVKNLVKEVGFRDPLGSLFTIELIEEGRRDLLLKGLDNSLNVFHLHGETVVLGENMKLLATGKFCRNQIVKIGSNSYGIQCHFELTPELFEVWINEDSELQKLDPEQLRSDFLEIKDMYELTGRQVFNNFLSVAGFL
jgi:GMP synthase-like glutamine amidotransferase